MASTSTTASNGPSFTALIKKRCTGRNLGPTRLPTPMTRSFREKWFIIIRLLGIGSLRYL